MIERENEKLKARAKRVITGHAISLIDAHFEDLPDTPDPATLPVAVVILGVDCCSYIPCQTR
jgi:hypothetical protein